MHLCYKILIIVLFTAISCGLFSPEHETTQSDFNVIFKYGIGARVEHNSTTKELVWEDKVFAEDEQADKLTELINVIREIVESKEAYKKLPPPTGGYL